METEDDDQTSGECRTQRELRGARDTTMDCKDLELPVLDDEPSDTPCRPRDTPCRPTALGLATRGGCSPLELRTETSWSPSENSFSRRLGSPQSPGDCCLQDAAAGLICKRHEGHRQRGKMEEPYVFSVTQAKRLQADRRRSDPGEGITPYLVISPSTPPDNTELPKSPEDLPEDAVPYCRWSARALSLPVSSIPAAAFELCCNSEKKKPDSVAAEPVQTDLATSDLLAPPEVPRRRRSISSELGQLEAIAEESQTGNTSGGTTPRRFSDPSVINP